MRQINLKLITAACLTVTCNAAVGHAGNKEEFSYKYISLDATAPAGCQFFNPLAINNAGQVYGTTDCDGEPFVVRYQNGISTALGKGPTFAFAANGRGVVGGADFDAQGELQAALFIGGATRIIPRQPGEVASKVEQISESGIALISSAQATAGDPVTVYYLYRGGLTKQLDFGTTDFFDPTGINDFGVVAGTVNGNRAFRFNPWLKKLTILNPLPTEPSSSGLAIHDNGDVLGYSFVSDALERIGLWRGSAFSTYFVEGTPDHPTVSDGLLWNNRNLIVVTDVIRPPADLGGFLIPRPGQRLALAALVPGLHAWTQIFGVNDDADLVGWGGPAKNEVAESFLLERVHGHVADAAATSRRAASPTVARTSPVWRTRSERHAASAQDVMDALKPRE